MLKKNYRVESFLGGSVRLAERCLPLFLLRLLLWPPSAALALFQLTYAGPTLRRFRGLPPSLRPPGLAPRQAWCLWRGRTILMMTKFLRYWPDRLAEPRWQGRCRVTGVERLDAALAGSRPVILVTLHYGTFQELHLWLRARGLMAAMLTVTDLSRVSQYRVKLNRARDLACGLTDIPRLLSIEQIWDVRDFLARPGRILIVAVDSWSKKRVRVRGPDCDYQIAPGALRLAVIAGAAVIPCLIRSSSGLISTIDFGAPVPEEDVVDFRRHASACEHIVRELLPPVASSPAQCDDYFFQCLRAP